MSDLIPDHLEWMRAAGLAPKTIAARERLLWHAESHLPNGLDDATPGELQHYLANPRFSPWTLFTYDTHLRGFYDWGYRADEYEDDPMRNMPRPPEGERMPDPCSDAELAHLLANAPEKPWKLVFLLAAYAGLRVSEAANLTRQDITEAHIRVRQGKGRKDGSIETHPLVWDAVKDLPRGRGRGDPTGGRVVRDRNGLPVTGYQLTNRAWYLFRKLGLPEMRIHRLRHWHATTLLEGGADLETVRQCMRHASITSTIGYTLIASDARRAAVRRLPSVGLGLAVTQPEPTAEAA